MKPTIITLFAALLFASCGEQPKKEKTETQETTVETKEETAAPQLRHVVLFKFNETSSAEEIAQVEAAFDALPSKISEIKAYEKGLNNSPENLNKVTNSTHAGRPRTGLAGAGGNICAC